MRESLAQLRLRMGTRKVWLQPTVVKRFAFVYREVWVGSAEHGWVEGLLTFANGDHVEVDA